MRSNRTVFRAALIILITGNRIFAAPVPEQKPDVSNKALITKATPSMNQNKNFDAAAMHRMAEAYYSWRNENYPVRSSDAGLHTWDDQLTDYSAKAIQGRARHEREILDQVRKFSTSNWPKEERIDWILLQSQLEALDFGNRILKFHETNPQIYVAECVNGIFSLLKKEYDTPEKRALPATPRLKQRPSLLGQG